MYIGHIFTKFTWKKHDFDVLYVRSTFCAVKYSHQYTQSYVLGVHLINIHKYLYILVHLSVLLRYLIT